MKIKLLLFSFLFFVSYASAQHKYSTSNKKAIKLFEKGQNAPLTTLDPQTKQPNYKAGIEYLDKALEKDPKFWEAHLLSAEYFEYLGNYEAAISYYEAALGINPKHSPSGATYFFLANLQHAVGDYEKSLRNLELFIRNQNANPSLVKKANEIQGNCIFAMEAIKNPKKLMKKFVFLVH